MATTATNITTLLDVAPAGFVHDHPFFRANRRAGIEALQDLFGVTLAGAERRLEMLAEDVEFDATAMRNRLENMVVEAGF